MASAIRALAARRAADPAAIAIAIAIAGRGVVAGLNDCQSAGKACC
ncbi:hypothetical protein [Janthinobacterium sp.]|nr:hypothetical protein [Janthinobacterium sp.]